MNYHILMGQCGNNKTLFAWRSWCDIYFAYQ